VRSPWTRRCAVVAAAVLLAAAVALIEFRSPVDPLTVALGILALTALFLTPSRFLPGLAALLWHGLNISSLEGAILGRVLLPELILIVWLIRELPRIRRPHLDVAPSFLLLALGWTGVACHLAGIPWTPLVHLVLLAVMLIALRNGARLDVRFFTLCLIALASFDAIRTFTSIGARLYGNDPAQLGFIALAAWIFTLGQRRGLRLILVQAFLLSIVLMTQTRSVYLALAIVIVLVGAPRLSKTSMVAAYLMVLAAGYYVLDDINRTLNLSTNSVVLRTTSISAALDLVRNHPLMGIGWADPSSDALSGLTTQGFSVYNVVLAFGVYGGIPAAVFFVLFLAKSFGDARHYQPAFLVAAAFLAQGTVEMNFFPGTAITFILIVALGSVTQRGEQESAEVRTDDAYRPAQVATSPRSFSRRNRGRTIPTQTLRARPTAGSQPTSRVHHEP